MMTSKGGDEAAFLKRKGAVYRHLGISDGAVTVVVLWSLFFESRKN